MLKLEPTLDLIAGEPDPRLSENALRVLERRYLRKDETGKVTETPRELFWRVAWNLAQADRTYGATEEQVLEAAKSFYRLMANLEFLPNSPTLMNAGLELQQLSACFAAGTAVSTIAGPKPVEEIVVGDLVLTHRGRYRRVVATMRREAPVRRVKIHRLPAMFATEEHPFLTPEGWVRAGDLVGRHVRVGSAAEVVTRTEIEFEAEVDGDLVYRRKTGRSEASVARHRVLGARSLQVKPVKAHVHLDEEIGWFFGMYLAEGEINPTLRAARFTLGLHEQATADRLASILRNRFALDSEITHVVDAPTSWISVRVQSKIFCEWLAGEFDRGFASKRLPDWIHETPAEFRTGLLQGVADGDGTHVNVNQTRITLSNEGLVRQLFELGVGLGHAPAMKPEYMPANATARPWSITLGGKPMYVRDGAYLVESVESVEGVTTVYNLEVEEDNTYVANGVVVHNCFVLPVEDSLAGIFQTLKESALIHQSGGGCVAGDSHVFTTFCGVERLETLYERIRTLGAPEEVRQGHRVMDISSLGVRTFAVNPATGRFDTKQVTHLWSWDVPAENQYRIRCSDGTEVTTSEWHPFLVMTEDGIVERRADALQPGDVLLGPNRSVRDAWPFTSYLEQEGFVLDEPLAWLIGFFLGDGSLDWFQNRKVGYRALRLRLFDGRPENIRFAREVLAAHGILVTPQQDRRGLWSLTTTDAGFVPRLARLAQSGPGPKVALTMPEWVAKSPLSVVAAFLGGLIDSDGYVSLDRRRLEFSTVCPELANRLVSLLSALGFNPSIRAKAPGPRAKLVEYRLHMADAKRTPELVSMVRAWVHDPFRGHRLDLLTERVAHNTHTRIPLPFTLLEKLLRAAGVETRGTAIHKSAVAVGDVQLWLHRAKWGDGIGEDKLRQLVQALRSVTSEQSSPLLELLEHLAGGWTAVEAVERPAEPKAFYDLTVADFNNYLAGGGLGKMAVVHNTGFSFSRLRPKNDFVRSTMGVASGPVSFMKVFDAATQQVKQGSRRRGANMGILRVDHPDILEFITCKDDIREITNFNISVAVTDAFMEAVRTSEKYDLVSPRTGKVVSQLDAREVFDKIAHQAWKNGEPGLFFIDETNRRQPTPHIGMMEATNPCGEQPLLQYESCNLGSIDLERHMARGSGGRWDVDWKKLERTVRTAARLLDNVIDMNAYPVKQIEEMTMATRKIGLGVMGFARMLFMLEVAYDAEEGVEWGRRVMKFIKDVGYDESAKLAAVRGPYPAWTGSRHWEQGVKVRNSYVTTVAPTGTLSMIADTSGGCEPEFSLIWFKRVMEGEQLPYSLAYFEDVAKREGFWTPDLVHRVLENGGRARGISGVPQKWQRVFAVSFDVAAEWHVRMQAAFQDSSDSAVSKTINLPREATVEDVKKAYLLAHELKCKGITVYRDGSREDQVLNVGVSGAETVKPAEAKPVEVPTITRPRRRPAVITGRTQKILTGYGPLYVTVNEDDKGLFELFAQIGRGGGYTASFTEGLARLVSLCLRSGVPVDEIIDQLEGIRSPRLALDHGERIFSIPDAIAKAIKRHIGMQRTGTVPPIDSFDAEVGSVPVDDEIEKEAQQAPDLVKRGLNPECPECGRTLILEEGCAKCRYCGYSEC